MAGSTLLAILLLAVATMPTGVTGNVGAAQKKFTRVTTNFDAGITKLRKLEKDSEDGKLGPPSIAKKKVEKQRAKTEDLWSKKSEALNEFLDAWDTNDSSQDHRDIGIAFDMAKEPDHCLTAFKAYCRFSAGTNVEESAYGDLGVGLLRRGNSVTGESSRKWYAQAKWAFEQAKVDEGNMQALQQSVKVQLQLDLKDLTAMSLASEIKAGSKYAAGGEDDAGPATLTGIFDDDDDEDDDEEENDEIEVPASPKEAWTTGLFEDDDDDDE